MKNLTAILAFLLFSFSLFAQYDRPGILISTSLGFSKKQDLSQALFFPINNNNFSPPESITKAISHASEVSYVINEKFMIGIGYFSSTFENSFMQTFVSSNNGVIKTQTSTNNTKNELLGPTLHLRFSQNIISRLLFSLKFTYLNLKGTNNFNFLDPFSNPNFPNPNNNRALTFNSSEVRFSPSLHYFISRKFGCYVETKGLNLNLSDSRKPNKDIDYDFDLNPSTWRVGLFYFIPTKKAIE